MVLSFNRVARVRRSRAGLLPMLCRNANISKDDIGAIRVQYQETFIEVQTSAVEGMKKELGEGLGS